MSSRSSNAKLASLQAFAVQLKGLRERISCNATQPTSLPRSLFGSSEADTLLSEDRMHEGSSERTRSLSAPSRPPPRPPIRANETVCCLHRASPEFNSMASISCSKSLNYEDANRDQRSTSRDVNLIYELHVLRGECERQRKLLDEYENLEEVRDAWKDRERLRAEMELLQRTKAHLEDALLGKDMELLQCNNEFVSYRQKMNFQVFDLTATNQKYSIYLSYEKALLGLVHEHWAESIKIRSHDISRLRSKSSKACQCDENTSVDIMNQLQSVCIQLQKALTVKEKDIEVLKNKLIDVNTRHQKRASRLIVLEREHQALNDAFETVRSKCEENVLRAREEVTFLKSENAMLKRKLNEWEAIDNVHEELRLLLSATDEENRTLKQKLLLLHHQKESG